MKKTYVIVGLGLLGGSLGAAISRKIPGARVIGISRSRNKIQFAKKKRFIDQGFTDLKSAARLADFVLICTPVDTIPKLISDLDRYAKSGTIVTDVGSTKSEIVKLINRKKTKRIQFVGSHPLAGSHLTGVTHAIPGLFSGATVFVTPTRKTSKRAVREVISFWKKLNAHVQNISPEIHDQIVSEISHLPHAAAAVLIESVSAKSLPFAASGFLDTTRVAQGDPRLWVPIFLSNRQNLAKDLNTFRKSLSKLIGILGRKKTGALARFLRSASSKRAKLA